MLYLGFPRYFIGGFPQGLIQDFQGVISWNFRRALSKMSEASRVFIQVFRFPRCLGLYMVSKVLIRDFRGVNEVFLGLGGGEEGAKRGSGTRTTEQQKKAFSTMFFFLLFLVMSHELIQAYLSICSLSC